MKRDPILATETIVKYLLYLNVLFLLAEFSMSNTFVSLRTILIINVVALLLRMGIKKYADKISAFGVK